MINVWMSVRWREKGNIWRRACPLEDSTVKFNLSKTDLNVFHLLPTVCGRQHGLQESEERQTRLLKKKSSWKLQGHWVWQDPPPSGCHLIDAELPVSRCADINKYWKYILKDCMNAVLEADHHSAVDVCEKSFFLSFPFKWDKNVTFVMRLLFMTINPTTIVTKICPHFMYIQSSN